MHSLGNLIYELNGFKVGTDFDEDIPYKKEIEKLLSALQVKTSKDPTDIMNWKYYIQDVVEDTDSMYRLLESKTLRGEVFVELEMESIDDINLPVMIRLNPILTGTEYSKDQLEEFMYTDAEYLWDKLY